MYSTTRASRVVAKLVLTLGLACLMVAASIAGLRAVPPLPHTLYGSVTLDGASAPDLTRIAVLADGATTITTTATSGVYTVNVPGNDGDTMTFAIYGYEIAETAFWQSGAVQNVDLSNSPFTYNETAAIGGSADVSFLAHDGNPGLIINANGHDLGSTEIVVRANQDCTDVAGEAVRRCFYITPTYSLNQDAMVTFSFYESQIPVGQTCTAMNVYHWNSGSWGAPLTLDSSYGAEGRSCAALPYTVPHTVRVLHVTEFSPFVLKGDGTPAVVKLKRLKASVGGGEVGFGLLGLMAAGLAVAAARWRKLNTWHTRGNRDVRNT